MSESRNAAPDIPGGSDARPILAHAEILAFAPGLYHAELQGGAGRAGDFPCARLHALSGGFAGTLAGCDVFLPGQGTYLRVPGPDAAQVLITTYRHAGTISPELRITRLAHIAAPPPAPGVAPSGAQPGAVAVYAQGSGHSATPFGAWAGRPGSSVALESFEITPPAPLHAASLEYKALLGAEWETEWQTGGTPCGMRDVALPLLGVRLRAAGEAAARVTCQYWGSFVGHGERGPFADGALCACDGAPLEALRVRISGI